MVRTEESSDRADSLAGIKTIADPKKIDRDRRREGEGGLSGTS